MFLWIAFDAKRHRSPALSSVATQLCVCVFFNSVAISMIEVICSASSSLLLCTKVVLRLLSSLGPGPSL